MKTNKKITNDHFARIYKIADEISRSSKVIENSEMQRIRTLDKIHEELNIVSCGFAQKISSLEDHIKFLETQIIGLEFKLRNLKNE